MNGETLQGFGSIDPDDLAVVICAAARLAGHTPSVFFRVSDQGYLTAIEVSARGKPIAILPTHPIAIAGLPSVMPSAIELAGLVVAGELQRTFDK